MKKIIIVLSGLGLLVAAALLAAVFFGAQAANPGASGPHKEIVLSVEQNINGEVHGGDVTVLFENAAELPDEPPAALGVYLDRSGDLFTIGSGSISVTVSQEIINDEPSTPEVSVSNSGPQVGFRVNDDTVFLQDTASMPEITAEDIEAGRLVVPGAVAGASLAELEALIQSGQPLILRVWGAQVDGVLTASMVVYEVVE